MSAPGRRALCVLAAAVVLLPGAAAASPQRAVPALTITSMVPSTGPSGLRVTLTGTGFAVGEAELAEQVITYNGVKVTPRPVSDTQVSVRVPLSGKTGKFTVSNLSGEATGGTFTVLAKAKPQLTSFEPRSGPVGTVVTIRGKNFVGAGKVTFGRHGVNVDSDGDDTVLYARVPKPAGTSKITVLSAKGAATTGTSFKVTRAPLLRNTGGSHNRTARVGGEVRLQGTNLDTVTKATVGGVSAGVVLESADWIRLRIPAGAAPGSHFRVTNPAGTSNESDYAFWVTPTIDSFSPASGPRGTVVEVHGSGFTSAYRVTFGAFSHSTTTSTPAVFTVDNDSTLHVTVPNGIPKRKHLRQINVWVKDANPKAGATSGQPFEVTGDVEDALGL